MGFESIPWRKKGRFPKSSIRAERQRYLLERAAEVKAAIRARDGSQGPASRVRRIDPNSPEGRAIAAKLV